MSLSHPYFHQRRWEVERDVMKNFSTVKPEELFFPAGNGQCCVL